MSEDDVLCTGVKECKKLKGATHTFYCGDKEIVQRPEYCSGRHPHLFRSEEDSSHVCPFINKRVEGKRMWTRMPRSSNYTDYRGEMMNETAPLQKQDITPLLNKLDRIVELLVEVKASCFPEHLDRIDQIEEVKFTKGVK